MAKRPKHIHAVLLALLRDGYGVEHPAKEPQFVERCQDDNAPPHIAARWLELERILAVFDLAEGLIIN
jgi:hypothetical protein